MNIMENKRVTAIAVAMAAVFGVLCYKGYESYNKLKDARAEIERKADKVESYATEDLPPTQKNSRMVVQAAGEVGRLATELSNDMRKYVNFCVKGQTGTDPLRYQKDATPVSFQNRLRALSSQISQYAGGKTVLQNSSGDFGMSSLKNQAPTELAAPYYNFLLSAVDGALRHIISSGAPTIERVYCAPLPEAEIGARKKAPYFPLSFEVAFTARRSEIISAGAPDTFSVLPQVVNKLSQDPNIFYIITGLAVNTLHNPPVPGNAAPVVVHTEGDQTPGSSEVAARRASLIVGSADEQVSVHLNIQVLFFTTENI